MESMMLKLFNRTSMNQIQSPFLNDIPQCRTALRKLRKKIYKYSAVHRQTKRPKDATHDIMGLLKSRNLPPFVTESLKKKRVIDINSLKNVNIAHMASTAEIAALAKSQETQISALFEEHKAYLAKMERKLPVLKFDRKSTAFSSTQGEGESQELSSFSQKQNDQVDNVSNMLLESQHLYSQNGFPQDVSNPFRHDGAMALNSYAFLESEKDLCSESMWLKF